MYKAFAPSVVKELEERGNIIVTIKSGWEQDDGGWLCKPCFVTYCIGSALEHIFSSYLSNEMNTVQFANIEATEVISGNKPLVDAYMYVALKGLIEFAKNLKKKRLVIDSYIPAVADHMLDLGFYITPKTGAGARGCRILKG